MKSSRRVSHEFVRQHDQKIRINDDIEVVVVRASGNSIRIGVHAPNEVGIHRQEYYERMQSSASNNVRGNREINNQQNCKKREKS